MPGNAVAGVRAANEKINSEYLQHVEELNHRFRQSKSPISLHNGFVQINGDALVHESIEKPFWTLVRDPKWKNVEIDMMEAVDRRESNERDPAFYGAKALESAIKIVSDERGFSRGSEKNVNHYIDNLVADRNGRFVELWEADALRHIFANVRNALGHGPGGQPMPNLTQQQTDWTIEAAMSWTESLILRL